MVLEMEGIMLHHTKMSLLSVIGNWVNFLEIVKKIISTLIQHLQRAKSNPACKPLGRN
jgi:hypothetical protein